MKDSFINCCRHLLITPLLLFSFHVIGQYTLRIEILSTPSNKGDDSVFVAGNFNSWNPKMKSALFIKEDNKQVLEIRNLPENVYEFKFTRGGWEKVETTKEGLDIKNRLVKLTSDTLLQFRIDGWRDAFPATLKKHTATSNVRILDSAFVIPQLNRTRRIWIYLPQGYQASKKKYPVLYMHDGQNDFDEYTAGFGEWGIDECVDSLIKKGSPASIIVGIDNGPQRMNEYNPFDNERFGKGEGDPYLDFIVTTLKPYIDKQYRTLKNKENTMIAGSSMGGLISYYAILKHPNVFGKAGIFSPAFWTASRINRWTDSLAPSINAKLFFYMGEMEGGTAVQDMFVITEKLGKNSNAMIYTIIDPEGRHNEEYWRKWFGEFYRWIIADGYNSVIKKLD